MDLSNLRPVEGSNTAIISEEAVTRFRNGKTAGKGHKGQKARSWSSKTRLEGGQDAIIQKLTLKEDSLCRKLQRDRFCKRILFPRDLRMTAVTADTLIEADLLKPERWQANPWKREN